jgi:hypothetical protein
MAKDTDNRAPTDAEIAAAQDIMRRAGEAAQAEQNAKLQPMLDLVAMPEYAAVRSAIDNLPLEFRASEQFGPFIMAFKSAFSGLAMVLPIPAVAATPALPEQ